MFSRFPIEINVILQSHYEHIRIIPNSGFHASRCQAVWKYPDFSRPVTSPTPQLWTSHISDTKKNQTRHISDTQFQDQSYLRHLQSVGDMTGPGIVCRRCDGSGKIPNFCRRYDCRRCDCRRCDASPFKHLGYYLIKFKNLNLFRPLEFSPNEDSLVHSSGLLEM